MREDRRTRRHNETVQEILEVSTQVMAEEGVAALSLAEVARRVGVRPPSLYQYFPSKMAVYDALFEHGMRQVLELFEQHWAELAGDPLGALAAGQDALLDWVTENPVLAQLMYWRPVPGFTPSLAAFEPSTRQVELLAAVLQAAVDAGQLAPGAASLDGVRLYSVLISGVISQQLANEPGVPYKKGGFSGVTGWLLEMFVRHYAPDKR